MSRREEVHSACLNILTDSPHSAVRIAELCTFARALGGEIDDLRAERDRLAAENAELRKCAKGLKRRHNTIAIAYWETCAELTAANATLDALRERLPEYDTGPEDWEFGDLMRCVADFHNILYPQPKETTDEPD